MDSGWVNSPGWVFPNFDWMNWTETPEGQRLLGSRAAVAIANHDQFARLLTALVRGERFSDGPLAMAHQGGTLLAIVERAEILTSYGRS